MAKINKVLYNIDQRNDTTDTEKKTARDNIGALGAADVVSVDRTDVDGRTYSVDAIHFKQKGVTTSQIMTDSTDLGSTVPLPGMSTDEGKVPVAYYRDGRGYYLLERYKDNRLPDSSSSDINKVLTVTANGTAVWELPASGHEYTEGDGIVFADNLSTSDTSINWKYTVGRNLHINQNNAIQTNLPGGLYDAPTTMSSYFNVLAGADFAGAYRLTCRHNTNGTYELALSYTASGMSSTITFIGTETVIGLDNTITVNPAAYISEYCYLTPSRRFGADSDSTPFNPSIHKAIVYQGLAQIGPTSNTQIAIWQDNGNVKISFTSIEVGRVGSTL